MFLAPVARSAEAGRVSEDANGACTAVVPARMSVVIPVHNRRELLSRTLLSLAEQTLGPELFEVVIADNASTDGIWRVLSRFSTRLDIKHVAVAKRRKFESCRVRNHGLGRCGGEIVVFLDSDVVVPPQFLENHGIFHAQDSNLCVLGRIVFLKKGGGESSQRTTRQGFPGPDHVRPLGGALATFLALSGNLAQYDQPWQFCGPVNLSLGRKTAARFGGFDESLDGDGPAGGDVAYVMKLSSHGVRLVFARWAVGFHQPPTGDERPPTASQRMESVRRHEQAVHERYGASDAYRRMLRKRVVVKVLTPVELRLTHASGRRLFRTVMTGGRVQACDPLVTFLLVHNDTLARLRWILCECAAARVSENQLEVLVLDPDAPSDDDYAVAGAPAEALVQTLSVPYALRYYPTGTNGYRKRLERIRSNLKQSLLSDRERDALLREKEAMTREYRATLTTVLDDRPRGVVSRVLSAKRCKTPLRIVEETIRAVESMPAEMPEEVL